MCAHLSLPQRSQQCPPCLLVNHSSGLHALSLSQPDGVCNLPPNDGPLQLCDGARGGNGGRREEADAAGHRKEANLQSDARVCGDARARCQQLRLPAGALRLGPLPLQGVPGMPRKLLGALFMRSMCVWGCWLAAWHAKLSVRLSPRTGGWYVAGECPLFTECKAPSTVPVTPCIAMSISGT